MNTPFNKAVTAVLGGLVTIAATYGLDTTQLEPLVVPAGTLLTALLVYLIPNKPDG
jgi:hypothetical protein